MSSDIFFQGTNPLFFCEKFTILKFVIAGAQKNMGPAGATLHYVEKKTI